MTQAGIKGIRDLNQYVAQGYKTVILINNGLLDKSGFSLLSRTKTTNEPYIPAFFLSRKLSPENKKDLNNPFYFQQWL